MLSLASSFSQDKKKKNVKRQKPITIADGKVKQGLLGISSCQPRPHQGQTQGADPRAGQPSLGQGLNYWGASPFPRAAAPSCRRAETAGERGRCWGCNRRRRLWQVVRRGKEQGGGGRNREGEQEQSKGGEKKSTEGKHLGTEGGEKKSLPGIAEGEQSSRRERG